jgi:hypothetical protein
MVEEESLSMVEEEKLRGFEGDYILKVGGGKDTLRSNTDC